MKAVIITPCLTSQIKEAVDIGKEDLIICADNSFSKALAENIKPDLIIGDFDTGKAEEFPSDTDIIKFPSEKDDTDTMLCIKETEKRGFSEITIVGGLSGRLDHTYANIQSLAYAESRGIKAVISDGDNEAFLMNPGEISITKKEGYSLSLFSYGEKAEGIYAEGVKYPICGSSLTDSFPLGVSNEITADKARISLSKGTLLIILSKLN